MKFPLSWIKEFIPLDLNPEEIGKKLTMLGIEVDEIEEVKCPFEGVVVGKVVSAAKHPNADKLKKAVVTDGKESFDVVCGAPNCREGLVTAFAKIGAVLKSGEPFTIKQAKIRGEDSFGMLCSPKELGLSEESDGILELDESYPIGLDLASIFTDAVFDLSLTPNLGHCQSVLGIARELAAATLKPLQEQRVDAPDFPPGIPVRIESSGCKRYCGLVIKGVRLGPSPLWMQRRLVLSGLRPINSIVDITNYIMLEMGQPLHAFDLDTFKGPVVVRQAKPHEPLVTLDEKARELKAEDLVIASEDGVLALAGVMGGKSSEVTPKTTNILLEGAVFDRVMVRKTAKRFNLLSDASKRFERGIDEERVVEALMRAGRLIESVAGGTISGFTDVVSEPYVRKKVALRLNAANKLLGTAFSKEKVGEFLTNLKMPHTVRDDVFHVDVPSYRHDVTGELDLIEDIAKLFGYEKFKGKPLSFAPSPLPSTPLFLFERGVRAYFVGHGLQEFLTCDLIGPTLMGKAGEALMPAERTVVVQNPVSIEQSVLRTSLLPGLLNSVKHNFDRETNDIQGFEIGRIHFKSGEEYFEQSQLGIVLTGVSSPHHYSIKRHEIDFYDLKGLLESFFTSFHFALEFRPSSLKALHPGRQSALFIKGIEVGAFGEVHPKILRAFGLEERVCYAEINLNDLLQFVEKGEFMKEIVLFPASERDLTITVPKKFPVDSLFKGARSLKSPLLEEVHLQDIYTSEALGANHNVTIRFRYRDREKTVRQEDVDREHQKIVAQLENMVKSC